MGRVLVHAHPRHRLSPRAPADHTGGWGRRDANTAYDWYMSSNGMIKLVLRRARVHIRVPLGHDEVMTFVMIALIGTGVF